MDGVTGAAGEEATSTSNHNNNFVRAGGGVGGVGGGGGVGGSAASVEVAGRRRRWSWRGRWSGRRWRGGRPPGGVRGTLVESAVPVALEGPGVGAAGNIALSIEAARRMEIGRRRTALAAARPAPPPERAKRCASADQPAGREYAERWRERSERRARRG